MSKWVERISLAVGYCTIALGFWWGAWLAQYARGTFYFAGGFIIIYQHGWRPKATVDQVSYERTELKQLFERIAAEERRRGGVK